MLRPCPYTTVMLWGFVGIILFFVVTERFGNGGGFLVGVIPDRREPYRRVPLGRVHLDERWLHEVQ